MNIPGPPELAHRRCPSLFDARNAARFSMGEKKPASLRAGLIGSPGPAARGCTARNVARETSHYVESCSTALRSAPPSQHPFPGEVSRLSRITGTKSRSERQPSSKSGKFFSAFGSPDQQSSEHHQQCIKNSRGIPTVILPFQRLNGVRCDSSVGANCRPMRLLNVPMV